MNIKIAVLTNNLLLSNEVHTQLPHYTSAIFHNKNFDPILMSEHKTEYDYWLIDSQFPDVESILKLSNLLKLETFCICQGYERDKLNALSTCIEFNDINAHLFLSMQQNRFSNKISLFRKDKPISKCNTIALLTDEDITFKNAQIDITNNEKTFIEMIANGDYEHFIIEETCSKNIDLLIGYTNFFAFSSRYNTILITDDINSRHYQDHYLLVYSKEQISLINESISKMVN